MSARRHLWVGHIGGGGRGGGERGTPHTGSRGVVEAACMRATSVPWTQLGATAEGLQTLTAPSLWCAHTIPAPARGQNWYCTVADVQNFSDGNPCAHTTSHICPVTTNTDSTHRPKRRPGCRSRGLHAACNEVP